MKQLKPKKKTKNPWLVHLDNFYKANKTKMSYTEAMKDAKKSYKPINK